jgi:hypothetical protein
MNKLFFPIILIIAAIGVYMSFTAPHYEIVKELRERSQDYQKVFEDADSLLRKRDGLIVKLNTIKSSDKVRIAKLIPDSIDNVRLVIDINDGIHGMAWVSKIFVLKTLKKISPGRVVHSNLLLW